MHSRVADPVLEAEGLEILPMIIQPYVENANWHGIMLKDEGGQITITVRRTDNELLCVIDDDGIGRKKSMELNAGRKMNKRKSMGMDITKDRMQIIKEIYKTHTSINIIDKMDTKGPALGTRVELSISV